MQQAPERFNLSHIVLPRLAQFFAKMRGAALCTIWMRAPAHRACSNKSCRSSERMTATNDQGARASYIPRNRPADPGHAAPDIHIYPPISNYHSLDTYASGPVDSPYANLNPRTANDAIFSWKLNPSPGTLKLGCGCFEQRYKLTDTTMCISAFASLPYPTPVVINDVVAG